MTKKTIAFIGCGNMGTAILAGVHKGFNVLVHEPDRARAKAAFKKYKAKAVDLDTAVDCSDIILLAVKPQNFEEILETIQELVRPEHLVISIAAGITTRYIEKRLGDKIRVVRTMPNLPVQAGAGMTAVAGGKRARPADVSTALEIFSSVGKAVAVDEKFIDAVTAVSGSGPAYVFLFTEMMIASAGRLGLRPDIARDLVMQTLQGSVALMERTKDDPATLRAKVTSKGGTTQAALDVFFGKKTPAIFDAALMAAKKRARELAR